MNASQLPVVPSIDLGSFLQKSDGVQTVQTQTRSPASVDIKIRGYHLGQIYSQLDGGMLVTARSDLESVLSTIDPALIDTAKVIPGPYGVRDGPGLAFLPVVTSPTPRYDCFETHSNSALLMRSNGGQLFGREFVYGGGKDWGFIFNYGLRKGSDFEAGNNQKIPSSYDINTYWGQLGFDPGEGEHIEFRYLHLDQGNTEYAGQFYDINGRHTDNFTINYVYDEFDDWALKIDAWHNETVFSGDSNGAGKRPPTMDDPNGRFQAYNILNRIDEALRQAGFDDAFFVANSRGAVQSSGGRAVLTLGGADAEGQLSFGSDIRQVRQSIQEEFEDTIAPPTNLPNSSILNPGLFSEWTRAWTPNLRTNIGTRVDWVDSKVRSGLSDSTALTINGQPVTDINQLQERDALYAFYVTNDFSWSDSVTYHFGTALGQRPPTLLERYSDGVFVALVQSGFSRLIGNPELNPERAWQIDIGMDIDRGRYRGRINAFHSWILDYITYTGNKINFPTDARLLFTKNTDLATLFGFEYYGEFDINRQVVAFGSLAYLEGEDQVIDQPLQGISPLEGRLGIRFVDSESRGKWGWSLAHGSSMINPVMPSSST